MNTHSNHTAHSEVAVVGGGVIGLACAWRLAAAGIDVALYERESFASGASRAAAGMVAPIAEATFGEREMIALRLAAYLRFSGFIRELEAAAQMQCGLRSEGTLLIARDRDEAESLDRELEFRTSLGLAVQRLLPSEAHELEPALSPRLRLAAVLGDYAVEPQLLTDALQIAAEKAGAKLHTGAGVERVSVSSSGGELLLVGGEVVATDRVLMAAGAWSGTESLLPGVSEATSIRPVKGQIIELCDPRPQQLLRHTLRCEEAYLVPRSGGRYALGASVEELGFDTSVTAGVIFELLRAARELVPDIDELQVDGTVVGLRPGTPDGLPLVGAASVQGLFWASGHYRNGVLLSGLTADLICDELTGSSSPADEYLTRAAELIGDGLGQDQIHAAMLPTRFAKTVEAVS